MSNLYPGDKVSPSEATRRLGEQARSILSRVKKKEHSMSNYPPGVTGNEYAIAGPDAEYDATRECGGEGVSLLTITSYGRSQIEAAKAEISAHLTGKGGTLGLPSSLGRLTQALGDIMEVDLEAPCPFVGDVTVVRYNGIEEWECPVCRRIHETELD